MRTTAEEVVVAAQGLVVVAQGLVVVVAAHGQGLVLDVLDHLVMLLLYASLVVLLLVLVGGRTIHTTSLPLA